MNKQFLRFTFFLLMYFTLPLMATAQVVDIPDPNLRGAIEKELGKAPGHSITTADIIALTTLTSSTNINDLTGLEFATNLTALNLAENSISDISALSGLINLTTLWLRGNSISDISALSGLTNLTALNLSRNSISDFSVLAGLNNLIHLNLRGNSISDFSVLAELTNLTILDLAENNISDISALSGLTNLTILHLRGNSISDISVLSGLTRLTSLYLSGNNISDISALLGLTNLTTLWLGGNNISDISALLGLTNLARLDLAENNISDISALSGLTNLARLDLAENNISDISALSGLNSLIHLILSGNNISDLSPLAFNIGFGYIDVWDNPLNAVSINTHIPALQGRGIDVLFDTTAPLNIPDAGLRAVIRKALGQASDGTSTSVDITNLTTLGAYNANISDLTGLDHATNLTTLYLRNNSISDISVLAGLTNLTYLYLRNNSISDISALSGLTNLAHLDLGENNISDISALSGLTNLAYLELWNNPLSNISALSGLTNLTTLWLGGNNISDISVLSGLANLTTLGLGDNNISDLSPLVSNIGLDYINVQETPLSYQSIHAHIPILRSRGVTVEFDNQPHPALLKISGDNQKGASFTSLSQPFVVEAQDANGSALAGVAVAFAVTTGGGTLSPTTTRTDENGRAQSTLTLGPNLGTNTVQVSAAGIEVPATFHAISDTEAPSIAADVNGDGDMNILDLVVIASEFGSEKPNLAADVNGDGIVNVLDLILVAGMFDGVTAAPSAQPQVPETLAAVEVQDWLTDARALEIRDPIMKQGIIMLEQLLISLTPRETELLANYPNPFNPETWIPYRLAEEAFVTLTIYDLSGQIVRTLEVGHRIASAYESRSKAVHWDGRNNLGEQVASGVYFYTLTVLSETRADDFSATRKMVILK